LLKEDKLLQRELDHAATCKVVAQVKMHQRQLLTLWTMLISV